MAAPDDPVPWNAPSQFGAPGRLARRVVHRATRPLEVRLLAREQRLRDTLAAQASRLDHLETRLSHEIIAGGRQVGWTAGELGRRIDVVERTAARATALAQPTLGAGPLASGTRIVRRCGRPPVKRAICSLATGAYVELLDIAGPSFLTYAERWGWDVVLSTEDMSRGRPAPWAKVPFVAGLLDEYEWVMWIDADASFVDVSVDIGGAQEPGKDLYLVEHNWGDRGETTANTGVFMMRAGDWSSRLLAAMWEREDLVEHRWWENAALLELLGYRLDPAGLGVPTPWMQRVKFLDLGWNSVAADRSPRPLINHHGGDQPLDRVRDGLLEDGAALRRADHAGAALVPRVPPDAGSDVRRRATIAALRFRAQLPDALNALGLSGRGAEVGVRRGEFSEWLLARWSGWELLSIDPWREDHPERYQDISNVTGDEHERFRSETEGRLLGFGSRSRIWRLTSQEAAAHIDPASLDFVYLDARHDEDSVRRDLALWRPKVRPGGVLAGHDYLDGDLPAGKFGVKSAVDRFARELQQPVHVTMGDWPWPSWVILLEPGRGSIETEPLAPVDRRPSPTRKW